MKTQNLFIPILMAAMLVFSSCSSQSSAESANTTADGDIHGAIISDNMDAVKKYISNGGDLNAKDPFGGSSPLITATVFGKPEMAKVLIDAGADINFQNNEGSTALITAAFFCRPEIVKMLLDKNADKTVVNKYGTTAYDNVAGPFDQMKDAYDMMVAMLGPMGLKLDYDYLKKTRPEIAAMLKP
ncbi:ankyrin repeat domain-containing protein [Pararhodonellum marinum]|uniref:ankyrin repeat domain-containing protein n=1 Tax=Pararhodonellum marinum TaxID=2755358 RepID=UPI001E4FF6F6|nr:ankyrin repeat domain-containing protein [Pararhodonellum marinum]